MMKLRRPLSGLKSLRAAVGSVAFSPLTEDLFADYAFDQNRKWYLTGTVVVTLLLSVFFAVMYLVVPTGLPPLQEIGPYWAGTLVALFALRTLGARLPTRHAGALGWAVAVICVAIAAEVAYFSGGAISERMRFSYGLLLIYTISIYALIQLRGLTACAAGWGTFFVYAAFAARDEDFIHGHFLQVCSYFVVTNLLGSGISYLIDQRDRLFFATLLDAAEANYETDRLLRTILPEEVAERMKRREARIADQFELVTVMFASVEGIDRLADTWSAGALVTLLNRLFGTFDAAAAEYGVDKIKTSGSRFLAAAGLAGESGHGARIALCALAIQDGFERLRGELGVDIGLSIGVHAGPLVAGVIGTRRFQYDVWGDTVNVASRMASLSSVGEVRLSGRAVELIISEPRLAVGAAHVVEVKGKGPMTTHLLTRAAARLPATPAPPRALPAAG